MKWVESKVGFLIKFLESGVSVNAEDGCIGPDVPAVLKISAVTYGDFRPNLAKHIVNNSELSRAKCNPRKGELIISRSNTAELVGACVLVDRNYPNRFLPDKLWQTVQSEEQTDMRWLFYSLSSDRSRYRLSKLATGSSGSMKNITKPELLTLPIQIPPLAEQKAIADVLSTWDQAIEKTQQLTKAKERQFDWMQDDIFESLNKSGACKTLRLNEVCKVTKGKQLNKEHMVPEGVYDVLNGGVSASGKTQTWNTEANTISISEGGNSCGFVNYNPQKFWAGGHCYVLTDILSSVYSQYLYFHLKHRERLIMRLRVGSGLPNIQKKDIEHFSVVIPTRDEQFTVIEKLSTAQAEITVLKKLLTQYQTQKRGLMQRLLTGEWRVNLTK